MDKFFDGVDSAPASMDKFIFIGPAAEVRAIEKSMRRAWRKDRSGIWPSHCDAPILKPGRVYGIAVEPGERHDTYYICGADTVLQTMLDEKWLVRA